MEKTFKHTEVEARLLKKWEETNSFCAGVHSKKSSSFPITRGRMPKGSRTPISLSPVNATRA